MFAGFKIVIRNPAEKIMKCQVRSQLNEIDNPKFDFLYPYGMLGCITGQLLPQNLFGESA